MAVISPQTDIYLLKVPLEISDMNQLTFANATAQYNYFSSLPKIQADDYTYQRKDGTLRFGGNFDEIITYNYCMYRNDAYSDKWFYAFITDMEYRNDNMTHITLKTDVWQTWQFDLNFKPVLIDREHTNDDTVGANTLPEGLELGEMVTNVGQEDFGGASEYCTIVEVSQVENAGTNQTLWWEWSTSTEYNVTPIINDISRGTTPLVCDTNDTTFLKFVRKAYEVAGLSDSIVNVYRIPTSLLGTIHYGNLTYQNGTTSGIAGPVGIPDLKNGVFSLGSKTFSRPSTVSGWIPKNNKLFTWPFSYFNISNNSGTSIPFHYEDFANPSSIKFNLEGTFGASGEVKAIPDNYKGSSASNHSNLDFSISGGKYPICSWKSDSYTNWLTQNGVNMETQWKSTLVSAAADIAGGLLGGTALGPTGMIMGTIGGTVAASKSLIETARSQMLAKTSANMVPDQVKGNLGAGDFVWAKNKTAFTFIPMSVKQEYAKCADDYFSMFGYATNRVKVPNITGRRNWNYVKTVGCYIEGDIPQSDMQEIKNMFDNGITLWHNPANFGNYGANNDII